jgi:hypothetical protein
MSRDFIDKVKRYAPFSAIESREFWLAVLILAFTMSWNKWGTVEFDLWVGLANLLIAGVMAWIILSVHHVAQRLWGIHQGLKVEHKIWWYGAGIAFITTILSRGQFAILGLTGTFITALDIHRLGRYRYGPQVKDFAMVALMGPVANIVFAGIIKSIELYTPIPLPAELVNQFFVTSLVFAAWNLLPLPPLDGSRIVFASRGLYVFIAACVLAYVFLLSQGVYSWLWALGLGIGSVSIFYVWLERSWG